MVITVPSIHQVVKADGWKMENISYTSLKQWSVMDRAPYPWFVKTNMHTHPTEYPDHIRGLWYNFP